MGWATSWLKQGIRPQNCELEQALHDVYRKYFTDHAGKKYLQRHATPEFIAGQVAVFRWYRDYLPNQGAILDWGCRHAPDCCLLRTDLGTQVELFGCDVFPESRFASFHQIAGVQYQQLTDAVDTPYSAASFDAVIASGVLEHVPMDYESLKELHRIMKTGGRLMISYLPNQKSVSEWWARNVRKDGFHVRLYHLDEIKRMLQRVGFRVLSAGYQTRLDLLGSVQPSAKIARWFGRTMQGHRLTAGIMVAAERVDQF